jgi:hypothetical protein
MTSRFLTHGLVVPLVAAAVGSGPPEGGWGGVEVGRWVIAALFAAVVVWLVFMPRSLLEDGDSSKNSRPAGPAGWLRSTRVWAVVVALVQMAIYLVFARWPGD